MSDIELVVYKTLLTPVNYTGEKSLWKLYQEKGKGFYDAAKQLGYTMEEFSMAMQELKDAIPSIVSYAEEMTKL